MAKIINSYTETFTHKDKKLEITINVYDEPCLKNEVNDFYTHVDITHHGKPWGRLFYPVQLEESEFASNIAGIKENIELFKTINDEPNKTSGSKN